MARMVMQLPDDLIRQFEDMSKNSEKMVGEMTQAGAKVVYNNILNKMNLVFNDPNDLKKHLKITKVYKSKYDDGTNTKVAFYGYYKEGERKFNITKNLKNGTRRTYSYNGVPVPLIVMAREFGSSQGEAAKPFVLPSFNQSQIRQAMLQKQNEFFNKKGWN